MVTERVAIITGGAKGIGRHVAHRFAEAGSRVAIADFDEDRLRKTEAELREIDNQSLAIHVDVRDEDQVQRLMSRVADHFGRIDVLVNDAGIVPHFMWGTTPWPRIRDMEENFWDRVMQTNLGGTFLCTKHVLPFMESQSSGHIVNLHGGGGLRSCVYVVSKDAIRTFTRFVAEEEREFGICVVCISPPAIATEDAPEEARQRMPSPEVVEQRFILAAQAGMEFSGHVVTVEDGQLVIDTEAETR